MLSKFLTTTGIWSIETKAWCGFEVCAVAFNEKYKKSKVSVCCIIPDKITAGIFMYILGNN
jgi:hypothetical protein